jgi:hypothetical protein
MLPDKKIKCHHTGFAKSCFDGVTKHSCQKWMQIMGSNPQTGADMSRWGCADSFIPLLLIENSQMQRQTAASIDSFRNEMIKLNQQTQQQLALDMSVSRLPQHPHGC